MADPVPAEIEPWIIPCMACGSTGKGRGDLGECTLCGGDGVIPVVSATALSAARESALEEAAQCAGEEVCVAGSDLIASRIRSLKSPSSASTKDGV